MMVGLSLIATDDKWHARADLSPAHIEGLVVAYAAGDAVPPVSVVKFVDGRFALVDGYHRHAARIAGGYADIDVGVVGEGDEYLAMLEALIANAYQTALPRSLADKSKVIRLARESWPNASHGVLAGLCRVPESLVDGLLEDPTKPKQVKRSLAKIAKTLSDESKAPSAQTPFEHMTATNEAFAAFRAIADLHLKACGRSGVLASCALDDVQVAMNVALAQMKSHGILKAYYSENK